MPRIKNWSFIGTTSNPYLAPELVPLCLHGEVYGHLNDDMEDGHNIITSMIIDIDLRARKVKTRNSLYILEGDPDKRWVDHLKEIGDWEKYKNDIFPVLN